MELMKHSTETADEMFIFHQQETGNLFTFTRNETREIAVALLLENLKEDISYNIEQMDGDEIDLNNLDDITPEEFADEVFENLRQYAEDLTYPTNEHIYEVIGDTFDDYEKK